MKCPHCGIEVRDTMTVCMYCGNKIPHRKGATPPPAGKVPEEVTRTAARSAAAKKPGAPGEEGDEDEEEGGLAACLQPGEQVLIGSLNISVKKFLFHAYLTDRRIFLIDTQEKKIKVTAKDIPLETITATTVEFSENSDPVLVLSIRSTDDEIKTMKLVFAGNGMDRSDEIDEWVELMGEQTQTKKQKKPPRKKQPEPEEEAEREGPAKEEEEEIPAPAKPPKAAPARQELRPAKRPVKDHEKQPPVKRLLSLYQTAPVEEEEPAPVEKPARPAPEPGETGRKPAPRPAPYREIPPAREPAEKAVKSVEVQSVMKGALKGAVQPAPKAAHRPVPVKKQEPLPPEPQDAGESAGEPQPAAETAGEEGESPIFCQNCGKKLPAAANFCPGCGSKITIPKEKRPVKVQEKAPRKHEESGGGEPAGEQSRPQRSPARKGPKGSEMTILHKFLRR